MCKYCEEPKEAIKDQEQNYNFLIWLGEETEVRYYDSGWRSGNVPFRFCPICASRLKEEKTDGAD